MGERRPGRVSSTAEKCELDGRLCAAHVLLLSAHTMMEMREFRSHKGPASTYLPSATRRSAAAHSPTARQRNTSNLSISDLRLAYRPRWSDPHDRVPKVSPLSSLRTLFSRYRRAAP